MVTHKLPEELVGVIGSVPIKPTVEKRVLDGIDEIQCLTVSAWTTIKKHGHDNQWEVWARIDRKEACICLIGEEHELTNNTPFDVAIMAIKGHTEYSYEELKEIFSLWGFKVYHGSLKTYTSIRRAFMC